MTAIKAKDQTAVDTLRGLKTRIQNEKTAKFGSAEKDLSEAEIISLIKSEVKRRKEAAETYTSGGRSELAQKEQQEAEILSKYLPVQMSDAELSAQIEKMLAENSFSAKDFGAAMGKLKGIVGDKADGSSMARLLKEKLK